MPKLTKACVERLQPSQSDADIYDDALEGFGVRVRPSGAKTFFIRYRFGGRNKRTTIGRFGVWTAETARAQAKVMLAAAARGEDPSAKPAAPDASPLFGEIARQFLDTHVSSHLKPSTARDYRRYLERFILPAIGARPIADVETPDVASFHHSLRTTPIQANRTLEVVSAVFSYAERLNLRPPRSNPCFPVRKFKEHRRERFLSADELARLGDALRAAQADMPYPVACIRLLILTGCRLNEIQSLKWEFVDVAGRRLNLPDSKTGAKPVYLGEPALEVLRGVPRAGGNPYVIVGRTEGRPLVNIAKPWCRIRSAAGLDDVRLHDLRHTYASTGVTLGEGLPMIGKLLGHAHAHTTSRYAHLEAAPALLAADRIAGSLKDALGRRSET